MYFPRTNGPKSERLYSERSSSAASVLALFIDPPLCPPRGTGGDDLYGPVMHGVGHHEQLSRGRHAKQYSPRANRGLRTANRPFHSRVGGNPSGPSAGLGPEFSFGPARIRLFWAGYADK